MRGKVMVVVVDGGDKRKKGMLEGPKPVPESTASH